MIEEIEFDLELILAEMNKIYTDVANGRASV